MRAHLRNRARSTSINAVPPPKDSADYSPEMERAAASILYRSPIPSKTGHAIYILNAAALPDAQETDFDSLLPYVLARLPGEDDLVSGVEYEVIFFAGGGGEGPAAVKKNRPGWSWFVQAYHVLSRAMRKRIKKLYIVHERTWVRMLVEMFSTIVSPKFRKKIVHASTLSSLALRLPIEDLLIPPSAYLHDRKLSPDIHAPYASGRRAFGAKYPLPRSIKGQSRLPRVLRETTSFILMDENVKTEGLFRIPPNVRLKEILGEAYDRGQKFIVWREGQNILPIPRYENVENVEAAARELDPQDTYGVHLAAGVCKFWYSKLREPIVPATCYQELRKLFGSSDEALDVQKLAELLSPKSEWSVLPAVSREILTRHLLPMLSAIAAHQDSSKMTPENLAVCFAATLLCGPDQLEDAKMSSIIRRIITHAVELWEPELRDACGRAPDQFISDLKPPARLEDYEDPLDERDLEPERPQSPPEYAQQTGGIVMKDNEDVPDMSQMRLDTGPPPLPPRQPASAKPFTSSASGSSPSTAPSSAPPLPPRQAQPISATKLSLGAEDPNLRRKPAPPLMVPPRYSTISPNPNEATESPTTYMAVADGFGPPRPSGWSFSENDDQAASASGSTTSPESAASAQSQQVKRKPVTPQTSTDDKL